MKRSRIFVFLTVLAMVLAACGSDAADTSSDTAATADDGAEDAGSASEEAGSTTASVAADNAELSVVVTTTIWGDVVSNVVGDAANVEVLFPIGADPHDHQLSAAQVASMQQANLVVVNGLTLEEGILDVIESLEGDGANILEVGEMLDPIPFGEAGHSHEDDHEEGDHDHSDEGDHDDEEGDHDHSEEGDHDDEEGDHDHSDEGDHDHGDEEGAHDDHSGVAHACGHFDDDAVAVDASGAIPDGHTRYAVELLDGSAALDLERDEEGELTLFLSADVPVSVVDEAGNEVVPDDVEMVGDECAAVAVLAVFDVEPGSYVVELGPVSGVDAVDIVWEETGHGDEAHSDEGDHDHEDEGDHSDEEDHDDHSDEHNHAHGDEDPHVWLDPLRVAAGAELIAGELAALDPEGPWIANAAAYAEELRALDAEIVTMLETIPEDRRAIVTNHEALGYFADRYDFEVVGVVIPGGSTLADPSSAELAELVELIEDEGVSAIFAETIEPTALADAVAAEFGGQVQVIELFTGSLGGPNSGGETYLDLIRTNAERIAGALG